MSCIATLFCTSVAILFISSSLPVTSVPMATSGSPLNKGNNATSLHFSYCPCFIDWYWVCSFTLPSTSLTLFRICSYHPLCIFFFSYHDFLHSLCIFFFFSLILYHTVSNLLLCSVYSCRCLHSPHSIIWKAWFFYSISSHSLISLQFPSLLSNSMIYFHLIWFNSNCTIPYLTSLLCSVLFSIASPL